MMMMMPTKMMVIMMMMTTIHEQGEHDHNYEGNQVNDVDKDKNISKKPPYISLQS